MGIKDYYKTLEINASATQQEVVKSFRRLALKYHPDKNQDNPHAEAQFKEIREAYETLVNSTKREEYNYKRWYTRSQGKQYKNNAITPLTILQDCERLINYICGANVFQVNFDALSYHIREILSDTNIAILLQLNNQSVNTQVINKILQCATSLPFNYLKPIETLLIRLAVGNLPSQKSIQAFMKQQQQSYIWKKYKLITVIAVTIILCFIIYKTSV